mgnify:CR=1 FL=1
MTPLDLQKANMGKRISAWLFDSILLAVLAVCFGLLLSSLLGYDSYSLRLEEVYSKYETQYEVTFDITQAEYDALTVAERSRYDAAAEALSTDTEAVYNLNMIIQLTMIIISFGVLLAFLVLEFAVPLFLKNGQTLGKKVFGLAVMTKWQALMFGPVYAFAHLFLARWGSKEAWSDLRDTVLSALAAFAAEHGRLLHRLRCAGRGVCRPCGPAGRVDDAGSGHGHQ